MVNKNPLKKSIEWTKKPATWLLILGLVLLLGYLSLNYNPLPSDEEMISYFHEHREELGLVVEYYRGEGALQSKKWALLQDQAGVWGVDPIGLWHEDPYSIESARYLKSLLQRSPSARVTAEQKYPFRKYGGLSIALKDQRYHLSSFSMQKEFYHVPVEPRISDGRLWFPSIFKPELTESYRIFPSLTGVPKKWMPRECVFRQIESRWFIRMCRLAD